jgi:hypothetical protein
VVAAAASRAPARWRLGLDNAQHREVLQLLGKRLGPTRDCGGEEVGARRASNHGGWQRGLHARG